MFRICEQQQQQQRFKEIRNSSWLKAIILISKLETISPESAQLFVFSLYTDKT